MPEHSLRYRASRRKGPLLYLVKVVILSDLSVVTMGEQALDSSHRW